VTAPEVRLAAALAGRYALAGELGRGAMATVYLADDVRHGRQVAIKVLHPEVAGLLGPQRFLREVELAARLNHPHILALYDSGDAAGLLFYVMPYVAGGSLRRRLAREGQLPVDEAVRIACQIAAALGYAHRHGVLHRDVKPENILLHEGEAVLADFGIALAVRAAGEDRLTATGLAVGTPEYMSPEQALAERTLDARSDVYALACVLYEMLAGELPYTGPTAQALVAKRLADPAPRVRRLRPTVPAHVEQALLTALARSPADRFATAEAFAAALETPVAPRPASVAVLPFENLSAEPDNAYFADGVTEDVIAHLAKVRALKVIARASVMVFKGRQARLRDIAAALDVTTLLVGSVRRAGDRVRIVAQLVDADTERPLWGETYDRRLTDIFEIQTDVALRIAAALRAELSADEQTRIRKEPTRDLEAYQLYLQGRRWLTQYTPAALERAVGYFRRAIDRDPAYALAHADAALAYAELGENGALAPAVARERAGAAADAALRLDPALGEAHTILGYLSMLWEFDWTTAEREFQRALELSPNSADVYDLYGRMCAGLGRYDEALTLQRRAQALDPLAHRVDVATTLLRAGRCGEAAEGARRAVELDPDHSRGHATLGWALFAQGRTAEGLAALERAAALAPDDTQWLAQLGEAYGMAGRGADARAVLRRLETRAREQYVSPYHLAFVHVGLGQHDQALALLERAVAERAGAVYGIKGSFLFAPLREHPRFQALLATLHLA
jgi:TolB-like protein/Flp pilus assembly protein TadD/tRNA A-37 threonylcarbamoyl transferase component Bud32